MEGMMSDENEMGLFEPQGVQPVQMSWGVASAESGPRALMRAMLEDARLCIERGRRRRHRHNRQLTEAEAWVRCDSREWLFSFASICDVLGIDADAARLRLLTDPERAGRDGAARAPERTFARSRAGVPQARTGVRGAMAAPVVLVPAQDATNQGRRVVGGSN
jgi:hypothetical protein